MQEVSGFNVTMFTPSNKKMANQQKVNLGRLLYKRLSREMKITASPKVSHKIIKIFIISPFLVIICQCIKIKIFNSYKILARIFSFVLLRFMAF